MRVIAGSLGGRRLRAPPGPATRPTSDRVREALFSILGPLDGAVVLDLFAGSGALGIEALSRGAARAVFVEQARPAIAVLRANLAALDLAGPRAAVRPGDARAAVRSARVAGETYDLVFVDPPYREAQVWGPELSGVLPDLLAPSWRVVGESDRRSPLDLDLGACQDRVYGDTLIRIHSRS